MHLPIELPPGIQTRRALPRAIAGIVLLVGLSLSVYGALFVRNTGGAAKSFVDPLLTYGSSRWGIEDGHRVCVGKAGARFRSEALIGYFLRARFWLDSTLPPLKLSARFSDYRLLEQLHLDATFPNERIVIRSRLGSPVLEYRIVSLLDPALPEERGALRLPQPMLLIPSMDERSFALSVPAILNQYLALKDAAGADRLRFIPSAQSKCGVAHADTAIVQSMIRKFIADFSVKGGA